MTSKINPISYDHLNNLSLWISPSLKYDFNTQSRVFKFISDEIDEIDFLSADKDLQVADFIIKNGAEGQIWYCFGTMSFVSCW